ncbi:MAG: hypothetical protein LBI03_02405, partial [Clostridiales bacterium]|nr:hypothetical protein [Clostridiales bacterium]
ELFTYLVTVALMGLVDYGITTGLSALGLAPLWAKSWASVAGFAGNFILRRWLVFRENMR